MIRMSEQAIKKMVNDRIAEDELRGLKGLEFICAKTGAKWALTLIVDNSSQIRMSSQRSETRTFATLDSAYKVASSIINSMTVIGK